MAREPRFRTFLPLAALAAVALAACGGSSPAGKGTPAGAAAASTHAAASTSTAGTAPGAGAGAGAGHAAGKHHRRPAGHRHITLPDGRVITPRPLPSLITDRNPPGAAPPSQRAAVVIGTTASIQQAVLGAVYAAALQAKGFNVTLDARLSGLRAAYTALTTGQIGMTFADLNGLLAKVDHAPVAATAAAEVSTYATADLDASRAHLSLLTPTGVNDGYVLAVRTTYALAHRLTAIGGLIRLGSSVTIAGPSAFAAPAGGLAALRRVYRLADDFRVIPASQAVAALAAGTLDVAAVPAASAPLADSRLRVLTDPRVALDVDVVAPLVRDRTVEAEGAVFLNTVNLLGAALTPVAIRSLLYAVSVSHESPAAAAQTFLSSTGLT